MKTLINNKHLIILWLCIGAYIFYFSYTTILRYELLFASYFDLGIMHQTVYNTYKAIATLQWDRFLEMTSPYGPEQLKRMAIHNDMLLAPISLLYFIYNGPQTLLVLQAVVLGLGAHFIYKMGLVVLHTVRNRELIALTLSIAYLLFPALQRANMFEFHAVVLSTTFLLALYYFWLTKRYILSFTFLALALLTKEQVGLVTAFFGIYVLWISSRLRSNNKELMFGVVVIAISAFWFLFSMLYIIPMARGGHHFALEFYEDVGTSISNFFHKDTFRYFLFMFGPVGFLSLLSPLNLAIAAPEFGINLLSSSWNMRNIVFHYTAVITPFVFIAAIYGVRNALNMRIVKDARMIPVYVIISTILFTFTKGPLPFSREQDIYPLQHSKQERALISQWKEALQSETFKVATTGHLAPHFSSRRYFYKFADWYPLADYIVLQVDEVYNGYEKDTTEPAYVKLQQDKRFTKIYDKDGLEVYKKI